MFGLNVTQTMLDAADDALLDSARMVVEARGGVAERIGGVELVLISKHRIIIVDGGDDTTFEWEHGKGVIFPMIGDG